MYRSQSLTGYHSGDTLWYTVCIMAIAFTTIDAIDIDDIDATEESEDDAIQQPYQMHPRSEDCTISGLDGASARTCVPLSVSSRLRSSGPVLDETVAVADDSTKGEESTMMTPKRMKQQKTFVSANITLRPWWFTPVPTLETYDVERMDTSDDEDSVEDGNNDNKLDDRDKVITGASNITHGTHTSAATTSTTTTHATTATAAVAALADASPARIAKQSIGGKSNAWIPRRTGTRRNYVGVLVRDHDMIHDHLYDVVRIDVYDALFLLSCFYDYSDCIAYLILVLLLVLLLRTPMTTHFIIPYRLCVYERTRNQKNKFMVHI